MILFSLKILHVSITTVYHSRERKGWQGARENEKVKKGNVLHILGDYKVEFLAPSPTLCPLVLSYVPRKLLGGVGTKSGYFAYGV